MKIRAIIIEDEPLAAERLEGILHELAQVQIETIAKLESVAEAVEALPNLEVDLLFCDIRLADGLSFGIFNQIEIRCPVIFTTAYEEYALKAFKLNSVDYLLKPIQKTELSQAIDKFLSNKKSNIAPLDPQVIAQVAAALQQPTFRTRFMSQVNDKLIPISAEDISFFHSSEKITWAYNFSGKKHPLDQTLAEIETVINPQQFFRINRGYLVNHRAVSQLLAYSNSRYKVELQGWNNAEPVIVARDRVGSFKSWLSGN